MDQTWEIVQKYIDSTIPLSDNRPVAGIRIVLMALQDIKIDIKRIRAELEDIKEKTDLIQVKFWICPECGKVYPASESICENCFGEDA